MKKLSVVLATFNEEKNIGECLKSCKDIAGEIIVVDEYSTDKTREIAEGYGAKVFLEPHHPIFHVTKQKAIEKATGDWILQLDADERVTEELGKEIIEIIKNPTSLKLRGAGTPREWSKGKKTPRRWPNGLLRGGGKRLFKRHQELIEQRDGKIGKDTGEIVAFFIPRRNMFLGKPLIHAGVYPDGVIRLIKKGKARFPQKSVHEQIQIDGEVSWLSNDLEHHDSPTLKRYFVRMNRYTDLHAKELEANKVKKNPIAFVYYSFYKPLVTFLNLFIRHKGFLDGVRGFLWSFFSAMHYPIAYFKYLTGGYNKRQ